jgi:anaerobic magnesium-protoporphyrin IX monomethyl ester cyclase
VATNDRLLLLYPRFSYPTGEVPLGILYLAASVRARLGIVPDILDLSFSKRPLAELERHLRDRRYEWVGISAMVTMAKASREVATLVREVQPDAKIVLGGPHPTTLPEKCTGGAFDFLVVGEAEVTLPELIERGTGEDVPGVWFRSQGEWRSNPARPPIPDLDAIPFPAFDLVDLDRYKRLWFQLDTLGRPVAGTSVLATRGCPYQCSFCQPTLERLFGKSLRKRSPGNLVAELTWLKERFAIEGFMFLDDTLVVDRKWTLAFAEEMLAAKLGLVFGANVRAELAEEAVLEPLARAGLRKIYVGIESYSEVVRNQILNKRVTTDQVERAVMTARKLGLKVQGYFMLGTPGETRGDVRATLAFGRRLGLDELTLNLTTPLPGTYLHQKYRAEVSVPEEELDYYKRYAFKSDHVSQGWLRRAQILGYLAFYLRPSRLAALLRGLFSPALFPRTLLKLRRVF